MSENQQPLPPPIGLAAPTAAPARVDRAHHASAARSSPALHEVLAGHRLELHDRLEAVVPAPILDAELPQVLDALATALERAAGIAVSGDDSPRSRSRVRTEASLDGDLPSLVRSFHLLWACVLELAREAGCRVTVPELEILAQILGDAMIVAVTDRTRVKERLERGQDFVAGASILLASSLDYADTLRRVTQLAVPALAEWCVVGLLDGGRFPLRCVAEAHADPDRQELLRAVARSYCPSSAAPDPAVRAVLTGQPCLVTDVAADGDSGAFGEARARLDRWLPWRPLGPGSQLAVPLATRGRVEGVLLLTRGESLPRYDEIDVEVGRSFAGRVAVAIQNAELYGQAQRAAHAREEIVAVVSHDLKDPLSVVQVGAVMIERALASPTPDLGRLANRVATIRRAATGMEKLIGSLLDLARIDAGQLDILTAEVEAGMLVQQACEVAGPLAEPKGIRLAREVGRDGSLCCDRDRILQVLSNLIGNGIKFTPERGSVTVSADVQAGEARFSVRDSGPGIRGELVPYVFERFWRAPGTFQKGNGLGLAIAKGIVEAHGGHIVVETAPGRGSTFVFTLPRQRG